MKEKPEQRAVTLGRYITENHATVRSAAQEFGISKSTVHKDVSDRLRKEDPKLFEEVRAILEINKRERHIRGGMATRQKYQKLAEQKKHGRY